ncbi:deoxyribodipyrimidine photo-lyase [Phenylobacterium sp.]|uniref:cryptochrome/photolyase family protein n=1 Tax=Phenylobacterium sp. TaxID=1871053 RepID=UPI00286C4CD6|nr:deoxyribodipyrimidine photo-lyase [Phenylobacterium sp.]
MTVLVWFRRDLRLTDNPALAHALSTGETIVPVFIRDDEDAGDGSPGAASRWWLDGSLQALDADLRRRGGGGLVYRTGPAEAVVAALIEETGARAVVWNRVYEPWAMRRDSRLKAALKTKGVAARSFNATLLCEPGWLRNKQREPYKVFTPFWRALRATVQTPPGLPAPDRVANDATAPSERLEDWRLRPTRPDWASGLAAEWSPGEAGAARRLEAFVGQAVFDYADQRNLPALAGTSRLSPHLHFGEIGPWQVWRAATTAAQATVGDPFPGGVETFLSELAWREFSAHLLFHVPTLPTAALKPEYDRVAWRDDPPALEAWRRGRTGYPIVDAGLRELWATGWMHNRVRMIVASFLIKDLLIDWRQGAAWFWDTLVDADLANNAASWQWVAGSGADAAPYFRVFNPVSQGQTFDPTGAYVRRWAPELAGLPDTLIHAPWTATPDQLSKAGVVLGRDYPAPIVDHAVARHRALDAYRAVRTTDL